jgi:aminoglycoside/choline kinase family phosphotransferase
MVPACYAAEWDPRTGDYVIILADLGEYRCGDQITGCSVDDARRALDVLVRLHSTWWNRTGGAALSWIPSIAAPEISSAMTSGCQAAWPQAARLFGQLISEEIRAAAPAFIAALPTLYQAMSSGAQTLAHTDFRLDNLLFGTRPEHHPLVVVDWSSVLVSKGVHDVAFLLTQNLTTTTRGRHERELVGYYHDGLRQAGVDDYSLQQCWEDYRLAALFEFVYAILIAGMLDVSNQRATAFVSALIERCAATITDLELLRLLAVL